MVWDGEMRAAREPRAQTEDVEESVLEENLQQDPEAQRLIEVKEKLDAERKRRKHISNKKYR
jgi:hypothetical protein